MPMEQCFEIIAGDSGQAFDPVLAGVFLDLREQVQKIREENG